MRIKFLSFIIAVFTFALLFGCVSRFEQLQTDMAAKGIKPLTGTEIKDAFTESSFHGFTRTARGSVVEYTVYNAVDGTTKGRAWGSWGEDSDKGKWYINNLDQYCTEWFGKWAHDGVRCAVVYPGIDQNEYIEAIVSGKKSKGNPDGIYRFKLTAGDTTN